MTHWSWRCLAGPLLCLLSACAGPGPATGAATPAAEAEFGPACAGRGHAIGSAAYRACLSAYPATEPAGERAARIKSQM